MNMFNGNVAITPHTILKSAPTNSIKKRFYLLKRHPGKCKKKKSLETPLNRAHIDFKAH